jgi:hypothetical protein
MPSPPSDRTGNYRPEYRHEWGNRTYYTQLRLDPLGGENAGAMRDALLRGQGVFETTVEGDYFTVDLFLTLALVIAWRNFKIVLKQFDNR